MNSHVQKIKTFFASSLCLTGIGVLLYILCYLVARDGTDYFIPGHPLPTLAAIFSLVSVLWFLCPFVLFKKNALPEENPMGTKPFAPAAAPIVGTLAAGAISFTYFEPADLLAVLMRQRPISVTVICAVLSLVGTVLGVCYYLVRLINAPALHKLSVILGAGPVALLTGLCGFTYFELDHHMNAPAKIGVQLAWIATMLFLLCELRCVINKAQPRRYFAFASIALYANACAAVPALGLLIDSENAVHSTRIMGFSLLCLCSGIYVLFRLIRFTRYCAAKQQDSPNPSPVPDQTGKDDQDGCQQQDSMAS